MDNQIIKILLVDDEFAHTKQIIRAFAGQDDKFHLTTAHNLSEAREQIRFNNPHLIISDIDLPDGKGTDLIHSIGEGYRYPTIIMTNHDDPEAASEVMRSGALDYLVKAPEIFSDMPHIAENAYRRCQLIDENKCNIKALQESEEKYKSIIENSLEGIYIIQDLKIVFCNHRFAEMFGFKDAELPIGKHISKIVAEEDWEKFSKRVSSHNNNRDSTKHFTFTARKMDGTEFDVETLDCYITFEGNPAIQGVMRDISTNRQLEAQLRQAQKMEAVGILAGGVAHDFNNLLTVISGHSQLALLQLQKDDPFYNDIAEILNASKRATNLTRQLLAFSRKQNLLPKVLYVNDIIDDMKRMLGRIISEEITLENVLTEKLWNTTVDPGQLEQVIVNLTINARDAMPNGGRLTITTDNVILDKRFVKHHPGSVQGEYVKISVADTGQGMSEEIISRIFEPFFTTKEVGKGTGLGLSMVYGFIKQSEGYIWVHSEVGVGATFEIYLPRTTSKVDEIIAKIEKSESQGGKEKILIAEDDLSVRHLAARTLERVGYQVYEAESGGDAYLLCKSMSEPVDLIISDVVMPNMGGPEMVELIRKELWHDIKVLYISGYTDDAIVEAGFLGKGIPYLSKPFNLKDFTQKVRELLDDKPGEVELSL
ncbi:response regulator [bacterium]|nr:response regulator [bacterium]